ncbi:hypothetical protein K503DRAFT_623588 [Rhizopogon vinicolor AM-OR11-026]|uniref:Uncharacterized protein n=1 Tax=Rhizopogon vinicolor AM-OR11-026 TaxID=1314800 RepID=A0A1B7MI63_9AGAM|nr:hypothetical protein K503DRAFT_623588 [Rhizopogon vinicolor AM-OR11-026]
MKSPHIRSKSSARSLRALSTPPISLLHAMAKHVHIFIPTLSLLTGTRYIPFDPTPDPPRSGWWCARARLLEPPKEPSDIITSSNGNAKSSAESEWEDEGKAKALHPGSKSNAVVNGDEGNEKDGQEVWLGISDCVLESHVMFVGEMKGDVGNWDLVRVILTGVQEEGHVINENVIHPASTSPHSSSSSAAISSQPAIYSEHSIPPSCFGFAASLATSLFSCRRLWWD